MVSTRGRNKPVAAAAAKRPPKVAYKGKPDGSPLAQKAAARLAAPFYKPSDGGKGWAVTACICPKDGKRLNCEACYPIKGFDAAAAGQLDGQKRTRTPFEPFYGIFYFFYNHGPNKVIRA